MDPENLKSAVRSLLRIQWAVLLAAAILTMLFMQVCKPLREYLGQGGFLSILGLGFLVLWTMAMWLNEYLPRRLLRRYCPHRREWLNDQRSVNRLWWTGECRYCRELVLMARPTRWQRIVDYAFFYGCALVLWAIYWFILRHE